MSNLALDGKALQRTREQLRICEKLQFALAIAALALAGTVLAGAILFRLLGNLNEGWRVVFLSVIVLVVALPFAMLIVGHFRNRLKRRVGPERGKWDLEYDPAFRKPWWRRNQGS